MAHFNKDTIHLRYRNSEGSYINLSIYDAMSIDDMWKSAVQVPGGTESIINLRLRSSSPA